jgi:hypothetical protein
MVVQPISERSKPSRDSLGLAVGVVSVSARLLLQLADDLVLDIGQVGRPLPAGFQAT